MWISCLLLQAPLMMPAERDYPMRPTGTVSSCTRRWNNLLCRHLVPRGGIADRRHGQRPHEEFTQHESPSTSLGKRNWQPCTNEAKSFRDPVPGAATDRCCWNQNPPGARVSSNRLGRRCAFCVGAGWWVQTIPALASA
jgi:hypothetical protein